MLVPSFDYRRSTRKIILLTLLIITITSAIIAAVVLAMILTRNPSRFVHTFNLFVLFIEIDLVVGISTTTPIRSSSIISASWSFDNVTNDLFGIYNGSLVNGASYSPLSTTQPYLGNGRALNLVSSLSQSFLISSPFFNLSFTSFTIEAWIYSSTSYTGDNSVFSQCQCPTCANQCLYFLVRGGRLYADFILNDMAGSTILLTSVWYHVAFVYNYETQQQIVYLNGIQDGFKSNADPYQGTNGSIQIGWATAAVAPNYFNGFIDNLRLTTRAKSAAQILSDASLIAYYSFDLPNPTMDNGPNGLHGIAISTATVVGRVNQAMRFTGTSSYFQSYGFYQIGFGVSMNKPFSISMWINPSSVYSSTFLQQSTSQSGGSCLNMIGFYSTNGLAGQLVVQTYGFPTIYGPFIIINTWTHFSWTYSPTNGYTLYINGILFGSTGAYSLLASGVITWLQIGYSFSCTAANINNAGYQGSIDEIYIHNRELTQNDVALLANP